jgi:protease-4
MKKTKKPVIAHIRGAGDSAAYWAISGVDRIFSLSTSEVGGIGVNSSYLDNTKNNEQNGYNFNDLSIGEFKNTFNPDKPLTETEKDMIMEDLQETHELFVNTVAENRDLEVSDVKKIANGWAYIGNKALSLGLVDEIGNIDSVKEYIEKNILDNKEVDICWY